MNLGALVAIAVSCLAFEADATGCWRAQLSEDSAPVVSGPTFIRASLDVVTSAQATLVWDVASGAVLYERNASVRRPVASLSKLASVWFARERVAPNQIIVIPEEARQAARQGADIQLPVGQHVKASDLIAASLIPSANDAMVSLAVAVSGSEEAFVNNVNTALAAQGIKDTKLINATGLEGGEQYSTAHDVRAILMTLYRDNVIRPLLSAQGGSLTTREGVRRAYTTTNKLLNTYVPVLAAKTGYTVEAGENLALITRTEAGHEIGAVVLGSENRFQDMKALVDWIERNYTWP